ncbi:MAG: IclR family transcriptional regulator [Candidatus Methylomirabilota bacterium]
MAQTANGTPPRRGVEAVERALSLLAAFREEDGPLTLTELAARARLHKSTALRLFASLLDRGFLRRLQDGRYHLGPAPLRLARLYQRSFRLVDEVVPALRRLSESTGETAAFFIRDGDCRICLHRVEPSRPVRASASEGDRMPLDRGAAGKVLLAYGDPPAARFAGVREAAHAVSFGERDPETAAIACPVFGPMSVLSGSMSVSAPRQRMTADALRRFTPQILSAAADLTAALGGDPSLLRAPLPARRNTAGRPAGAR